MVVTKMMMMMMMLVVMTVVKIDNADANYSDSSF